MSNSISSLIHNRRPEVAQSSKPSNRANANSIVGVAIFGLDGLPKEYLTVDSHQCTLSGVDVTFQSLKLLSLLISSFQFTGFSHTITCGDDYCAIVFKKTDCYAALLVRQTDPKSITNTFVVLLNGGCF